MKAQRTPPEYTITDDDGEMIARMVQDCLAEDFDHVVHHRDRIQEELADMRQFLKKIGEVQTTSKQHGNRAINTADRGKSGRRRMRSSPYNTAAERNIPHHTQYVAHG
jgi:hypothetical protein